MFSRRPGFVTVAVMLMLRGTRVEAAPTGEGKEEEGAQGHLGEMILNLKQDDVGVDFRKKQMLLFLGCCFFWGFFLYFCHNCCFAYRSHLVGLSVVQ